MWQEGLLSWTNIGWTAAAIAACAVAVGSVRAGAAIMRLVQIAESRYYHETRESRQLQITNRFGTAVDGLTNPQIFARVGSIYTLELLMKEAPDLAAAIVDILIIFLRESLPKLVANEQQAEFAVAPDINVAFQVIGRRSALRDADITYDLNFSDLDLRSLDLKFLDLQGARFTNANLDAAFLMQARLEGTSFQGASLNGANLGEVHLERANLSGANLSGTYLAGAHLEEANLSRANLSGALLDGAHLEGALLWGANFEGASFSSARGFCAAAVIAETGCSATQPDGTRISSE